MYTARIQCSSTERVSGRFRCEDMPPRFSKLRMYANSSCLTRWLCAWPRTALLHELLCKEMDAKEDCKNVRSHLVLCRLDYSRIRSPSSRLESLVSPPKASADQVPAHHVADALHTLAATDALDHAASSVSSIYTYLVGKVTPVWTCAQSQPACFECSPQLIPDSDRI